MKKNLTQKEIDRVVIAEADDPESWHAPIFVNRKKVYTLVGKGEPKPPRSSKASVLSKTRSAAQNGTRKVAKR